MDYTALAAKLTELSAPADAGDAASAINAATFTRDAKIEIASLNAIADGIGLTPKLRILARKTDAELAAIFGSDNVQNLLGTVYGVLSILDAKYAYVDCTSTAYRTAFYAVLGGLEAFGLVSQAEAALFTAKATETVPWATTVLGRTVDYADVERARAI